MSVPVSRRREGAALAVFVLVHPAWFGGWCWKKLVPLLEEHGHSVRTPTLTGLGERSHLAHPGIVMRTHIDDVASVLIYDDLREVILAGTSSSGAVISGVADRVPERISQLVYVDAFVPDDGQAVFDLISPQRRPAMEAMVESEGFGWLLPRYAPPPWEQVARQAWQVTDEADLRWMLPRLRPTPSGISPARSAWRTSRRNSCRGPTSAATAFRTRASTATPRPPARTLIGAFSTWKAATCLT
jgi:pimeloyl-ACP methyl ester carboxylesterase